LNKSFIICLIVIIIFSFLTSTPKLSTQTDHNSKKYFSVTYYLDELKEEKTSKFIASDLSFSKNDKGIMELKMDPNVIIKQISDYILNMKMMHNSADTIKRILLGHLNSAELILKDGDSDNNNVICENIIPKFISDLALYEKINILKSNHANKIHQQIEILQSSLCKL